MSLKPRLIGLPVVSIAISELSRLSSLSLSDFLDCELSISLVGEIQNGFGWQVETGLYRGSSFQFTRLENTACAANTPYNSKDVYINADVSGHFSPGSICLDDM